MRNWEARERKQRKARYGMRISGRSCLLLAELASRSAPPRRKKRRHGKRSR